MTEQNVKTDQCKSETVIHDKVIVQDLVYYENNQRELVMRSIIDTMDRQIREALIKLGWTPPDGY
jgi:hypothetical protein